MQNLHTHSTRSSYSSGRTAQGQDILISALKRQASLTERDMSSAAYLSHHDQLSNLAAEVAASHYAQRTTTPPPHIFPNYEPEVTKTQDQQQQQQQQRLKNSGGTFRQKRLASLQVGSPVLNNDRQDFNDGYTILKKGPPAVSDHIPSIHDEPLSTTPPGSQLYHSGQNPGSAGNRISTPAVMMSKIKYDWALSPTLPEIPVVSRFGFGPLDNIEGPGLGLEPVQIAEGHPISEPPTPFLSEQNPSLTTTTVKMMGADNIERRSAAPVLMNGDVLKVPSLGPLGGSLSAPAVPTEADFKEGDKSMSTRRDA
ncbi:hypothetical protein BC939DRAFT_443810 [Gamsiella multidivaricata]|uniref:uncharacterized protein n=1 Tax=Gamsiella multidivaricata TaxID=101098 RepID=UPI00221E5224|nr:uncharacterized protein BC939DRAFT_443810 [Gamsiella multidivaricata]KAI7828179.1 hypothetical protein BC939DRAFT_443810 [Gamsiella multidivaricata]